MLTLRHTPFAAPLLLALSMAIPVANVAAQSLPPDSTVGRHRIQPLPALGSAPETGLQYGVTVLSVFERAAVRHSRPATFTASALRTAKGQARESAEGEHWSPGNARRLAAALAWQRYPLPYYGIGDSMPESAKESYAQRGIEATASVQQRIVRSVYAVSSLRVVDQRITPDSTGALRTSGLTGVDGGRTVEVAIGALGDTRDNLFSPSHGHLVQLTYSRATSALGSDFSYGRLRFDGRAYRALGGAGTVAAQAVGVGVNGDVPFDGLALVGGSDIMRGYARGRYRDRIFVGAQAEYRTPLWHRLGGVMFGGAGAVAERADALSDGRVLPAYGGGLRVAIDRVQRTAVRVDYGRGRDGNSGLYIGFNQAF